MATPARSTTFEKEWLKRASQSIRHPLTRALLVLTAVTGLVDAVSYLGLGRVFTANMTGNVVLLAFATAGVPGLSVPRSFAALAGFFAGAAAGGRLAAGIGTRSRHRWISAALIIETMLL